MQKQDHNSRAHDLLLLMFNLSQMTLKEKIIDVFTGALGQLWPDRIFVYRPVKPDPAESSFEISASGSNYGYVCIEKSAKPEDEELALLYNATAMLAIIIKKNEQAELLLQGKTEEIAAQNEEYQAINEELTQTNRELAESKNRAEESEVQFKNMFDRHGSIMLLIDPESGLVIDANEASASYYGYSKAELLTLRIEEINMLSPEQVMAERERAIKEERSYFVFPHKLASGEVRTVEVHSSPIVFQDRQILFSIIHDITDRMRAEEEIKNNERRFGELFESLPQLVWTCRVDGPCDYLSKQWVEFTGIPETEQLGYRWLEQLHPDDRDRTVSKWMEKVKTGESFDVEYRIRRNDGVYHWFKARALPIHDAEGNIRKWFGSNTDIEEIKKTEQVLLYLSSRQQAILSTVPEIIMEVNSSKVYTWANQSGIDFFGDDVAGKEASFYFEGEQETYENVQPLFNGDENVIYLESWQRRKDGEKRLLAWQCRVLKDEHGNVCGSLSSASDITERNQAEKALLKSEERFTLAMKASSDGLFDWNLETNDIYYAPAWKRMLGYKDDELPNDFSVWESTTEPEDVKKSWELQQKLISQQIDRFVLEFKMKHKNGHWVDILSRAEAIFNDDGRAIRIVGTHTDITERKRAEEALRQSEAIKNKMLSNIGDVIVIVCHNGITQYTSPNITTLFGWKPEEMVGKKLWDTIHPDDLEAGKKFIDTIVTRPNATGTAELRYKGKEGDYGWIEITMVNLLHDNDIQGLLGNYHDISERKKSEEKTLLLTSILEYSQDFIGVATTDQKAFYVNKAGQKILGIESDALAEITKIEDYFFPEDLPFVNNTIIPTLMREGRWVGEFRFRHFKTGEPVYVFYDLFLTEDPATKAIINISTISRDITESRKSEQEIQNQLNELRRWHEVTLGREGRVLELKQEVNELLKQQGEALRYESHFPDEPDVEKNKL